MVEESQSRGRTCTRERSRPLGCLPGVPERVSILVCLVFQRHLIPRLRYVGRIVFEPDISLRRIRRVEFRGNSHKEYYRSVQSPPAISLFPSISVFPYLLFHSHSLFVYLAHRGFFSFVLRSFLLLYRYRDTLF